MAGLVKAKKYDWKDSNMALFGSDTEREVKKESACSEPAWQGVGQKVGLQIWRIVKFKVTAWPRGDYGQFFNGDSYIILNTYKSDPDSEALDYDVHFWIGSQSTQDEYGTAAYKTVELDTFLDDAAVQHREVEGKESTLFKSYFPKGITIMNGGAESGFNRVQPEEYKKRLLHFSGEKNNIVVREVPCCRSKLNSGDVYILDLGQTLYQWNGSGSNKNERWKAMEYIHRLKDSRPKFQKHEVLDEENTDEDEPFYTHLTEEEEDEDEEDGGAEEPQKTLYRVSDDSGEIVFSKVKDDSDEDVSLADFDSGDVFVLDNGKSCFVWVGSGASPTEKKNGIGYAHKHLGSTAHPLIPITVVKEGQHSAAFQSAIAA
jgi:gelsolin